MSTTNIFKVENSRVTLLIEENHNGIFAEMLGFGDQISIRLDEADLTDIRDMITNYLEGDSDESE